MVHCMHLGMRNGGWICAPGRDAWEHDSGLVCPRHGLWASWWLVGGKTARTKALGCCGHTRVHGGYMAPALLKGARVWARCGDLVNVVSGVVDVQDKLEDKGNVEMLAWTGCVCRSKRRNGLIALAQTAWIPVTGGDLF